jgi:hypothetical protein
MLPVKTREGEGDGGIGELVKDSVTYFVFAGTPGGATTAPNEPVLAGGYIGMPAGS